MNEIVKEVYAGVIDGNSPIVQQKVRQALEESIDPAVILNEGMIAAMAEVGRLFESGDYFVPEMLIAARAMQNGMALLKPLLVNGEIKSSGKAVIGTVKGDLHDIGKNLVLLMMEGAGFEIIDLGTDVSPEKFVQAAQANKPDLICMSALLTTTMLNMKTTIDALTSCGIRDQVKVLIGGAPVTETYAQQIGADGFAPDASRAVKIAKTILDA
jgi:5-methyltetrahydrofolate--homocysteine methyltransferase